MKYRCACFDIDGILENPALAAHISSHIRHTVPGFGRDYQLCTFKDRMDFSLCVTSEDGQIKPLGVDLHYSADDTWTVICDAIIDNTSTSHEYIVRPKDNTENRFAMRVICPDVMAEIKPGCEIFGQVAAFGAEGKIAKESDSPASLVAADDHAVMLNGEIIAIYERSFVFEDITRDYYKLEVKTELGPLTVVFLKKKLDGIPEIGDTLFAKAYLSLDVGISPDYSRNMPPYKEETYPHLPGAVPEHALKYGCSRNHSHALTVLAEAAKRRDALRFGRCCAYDVLFVNASGKAQVIDRWSVVHKLNALFQTTQQSKAVFNRLTGIDGKHYFGSILLDGKTHVVIDTNEDGLVELVAQLPADQNITASDPEQYLLGIFAEALCFGKASRLQSVMNETCTYRSEFSGKSRYGLRDIMESIRKVLSNLDETMQYRYEMVPAAEEIREESKHDLPGVMRGKWCCRLWQKNEGDDPVAVVFIRHNAENQITHILLSRDGYDLKSFAECGRYVTGGVECYETDTSVGVENVISAMRKEDISAVDASDAYVWQTADRYIRDWLHKEGYQETDIQVFDDCIGYACTRNGIEYAIYMYAYGERKTTLLNAEYCAKLHDYALSKNRTILVTYLHVSIEKDDCGNHEYLIGRYGTEEGAPELWRLGQIGNKHALLYFPGHEPLELGRRFTAAYNTQRLDILKALCIAEGLVLADMHGETAVGNAVYNSLSRYFRTYGMMKTAFIRYNDVVYCEVPYLGGFCHINWITTGQKKIKRIELRPLDETYREIIVCDDILTSHPLDEVPPLEKVEFLPASEQSRFSMLLTFSGGETRRYDAGALGNDEVVTWQKAAFTDKIFRHGRIANPVCRDDQPRLRDFHQQHQGIEFINGATISTAELYHDSYAVNSPEHTC